MSRRHRFRERKDRAGLGLAQTLNVTGYSSARHYCPEEEEPANRAVAARVSTEKRRDALAGDVLILVALAENGARRGFP